MSEPTSIIAGDTIEWDKSLDDYSPTDGWTLHYRLLGPKAIAIDDSYVVADGGSWAISIPASVTVAWTPGAYTLYGWVTSGSDSFKVVETKLEIKQDFRTQASPLDNRSHVRKTLDAIEAAIEGIAARQEASYTITLGNGQTRTFTAVNRAELITMHSHYSDLYRQEQMAERINQGKKGGNKIQIRFTGA
jgi:hypothetical protein